MRGLDRRVAALEVSEAPRSIIYVRPTWEPWRETEDEWRAAYEASEADLVRQMRNGLEVRFVIFEEEDRLVADELTSRAEAGD